MPNPRLERRILLVLIIFLLVSISYLALEAASYFGGSWQSVSGHENPGGGQVRQPFTLQVPERADDRIENVSVIRTGQLFFKPHQAEEVTAGEPDVEQEPPESVIVPSEPAPPEEKPQEPIPQPEPPKPTSPYYVSGILWGEPSSAILVHRETRKSQTVRVGTVLDDYTVTAIERDFVRIAGTEAEFKLNLGGM